MSNHRYGLQFNITTSNLHLLLCILLAGDIATNPGPVCNSSSLGLKVLYFNARSLKALVHPTGDNSVKICKISLLQQLTYSGNYDVVCVCETWLNNSILSSEILTNYGSVFRCDRVGRIGGGVLVAVKTGIQVTRRHDLEPENTEIVVIEMLKPNSKPVVLYTFYRPPNSTPDVLQSLNNSLQRDSESSRVVVIGDFNLPSVKWSSDQHTPINIGSSPENEAFCELVEDNFLQQFILSPTHIAGNILDLLLCNTPNIIGDVSLSHPESCGFPTDHYIVELEIHLKFKKATPVKRQVFDYKNGNFDGLRNFLTQFPISIVPTNNIDDCWQQWKYAFLTAVKRYVPMKTVKDINTPPWVDKEVRNLISRKYKALKKYRMNKTITRKSKLRALTQRIKKRQNNEITYNGVTAKTAKEKATLFNSYFSSVFHPSSTRSAPSDYPDSLESEGQISEITLDVDEISQCLSYLDTSKATGPDGIPSRLLQACSLEIAPSICELFNHSLHSGHIPSEWKSAN
ncbi:Hypothetical predicted protein, partial [Paramuricea clavata]